MREVKRVRRRITHLHDDLRNRRRDSKLEVEAEDKKSDSLSIEQMEEIHVTFLKSMNLLIRKILNKISVK